MNATTVTDTQLSAWLDDQLEGRRTRARRSLAARAPKTPHARLWAADAQALRSRLDAVLAEPVPARLEQALWRRAPARASSAFAGWQRWAAAAAAFALGGVVGAGLVWRAERPHRAAGRRAGQRPGLGAARRGGAQRLRAGSAPPGRGEGAGGTPRALADQAAGDTGQSCSICVRRASNWSAGACCPMPRAERAAHVPGHGRAARGPAPLRVTVYLRKPKTARRPRSATSNRAPPGCSTGSRREPRPAALRLRHRRRTAQGAPAGAGASDRPPGQ